MRNHLLVATNLLFSALIAAGCLGGDPAQPLANGTAMPGDPPVEDMPSFAFERVADNLSRPVHVTHAGDGSGRLFVVEQDGRILVIRNGTVLETPFLDLRGQVSTAGWEQGLLSIAFHPGFPDPPYAYVYYTDTQGLGNTKVERYSVSSGNPDRLDPSSARVILEVVQPARNHNGGLLKFGPDGYLYIGLGDGGGANDQYNHGQNPLTLLATILRIDVNVSQGYRIPADNPYAGHAAYREEIWAWGLRNPWRFSFDRFTGDLYIGDVGQNDVEEINVQPATSRGGENYGWPAWEGSRQNRPVTVTLSDPVFPVAEYEIRGAAHCSVTGGYVYRGQAIPSLEGFYVFGDFCSGMLWVMHQEAGQWRVSDGSETQFMISTFGEDESGELYLAHHNTSNPDRGGSIWRLVPAPPADA